VVRRRGGRDSDEYRVPGEIIYLYSYMYNINEHEEKIQGFKEERKAVGEALI